MIRNLMITSALNALRRKENLSNVVLSINSSKVDTLSELDREGFVFTPALLNYDRCFTVAFKPSSYKKGEFVEIYNSPVHMYKQNFKRTITGNCAFSYVNHPEGFYCPDNLEMSSRAMITDAEIEPQHLKYWHKVEGFSLPIYLNKERVAMASTCEKSYNVKFIKELRSMKGYLGDFENGN